MGTTYPAVIYKTPSLKQRITFQGSLIGCTDTCFAMAGNAQAIGGIKLTEALVRSLSNERFPNPASPGLNQDQLVDVARKLHFPYSKGNGNPFTSVITRIEEGRRVVAQLWYADIGGSNIGHAIFLESRRKDSTGTWVLGGVDPIKGRREWFKQSQVEHAMEHFGRMNGLGSGGTFHGYTRIVPLLAQGAKP